MSHQYVNTTQTYLKLMKDKTGQKQQRIAELIDSTIIRDPQTGALNTDNDNDVLKKLVAHFYEKFHKELQHGIYMYNHAHICDGVGDTHATHITMFMRLML